MKKIFTLMVSLVLFFSVAIAPVWAEGGKNQGDVGTGEVDQGDTGTDVASPGSEVGNEEGSAGSDAMGNQV